MKNIIRNVSLFIAREEEMVSLHTLINGKQYRRIEKCTRICGIPFNKRFYTEWAN